MDKQKEALWLFSEIEITANKKNYTEDNNKRKTITDKMVEFSFDYFLVLDTMNSEELEEHNRRINILVNMLSHSAGPGILSSYIKLRV